MRSQPTKNRAPIVSTKASVVGSGSSPESERAKT